MAAGDNSNPIAALVGDALLDASGNKVDGRAVLGKKAVALYFSAHWCPPCRRFTPMLAESYTKALKAKGMEIVFISSDHDEASFNEYRKEMPWLAVPYELRDVKAKLGNKYKVRGIPTLVVLDGATGQTITTEGVQAVASDLEGARFPWKPPSLDEALAGDYVARDGARHSWASLRGKTVGLYFSASWCGPCRAFTPELVKAYEAAKADGKQLEIIFVSADRDAASADGYWHHMPWLMLPFGERARAAALEQTFNVEGYPTLVFVNQAEGWTNPRGRVAVMRNPKGFPWAPKLVGEADEECADAINSEPTFFVFAGAEDAAAATAAVEKVAAEVAAAAKAKGEDVPLKFFIGKRHPIVERIASVIELTADNVMVIVVAPEGVKYVSPLTKLADVTEAAVRRFVQDFLANKLDPQPISNE